jgi:hypothetical protein
VEERIAGHQADVRSKSGQVRASSCLFKAYLNETLPIFRTARFLLVHGTKTGKIYQMHTKGTK